MAKRQAAKSDEKPTEKRKPGRPPANIDVAKLEECAKLGASLNMTARILGVDRNTLKRFSQLFDKKKGEGQLELLKLQWATAQTGNPALLIWLGKNRLRQSDSPQEEIETRDDNKPRESVMVEEGGNEDNDPGDYE
jgi:hypothetical protein